MGVTFSQETNDRGELRSFALTLSAAVMILSFLLFWKLGFAAFIFAVPAVALLAIRMVRPEALRIVRDHWLRFSTLVGTVNTCVLLTLIFFLVITPIGCAMRMFGKDPLRRSLDSSIKSYWIFKANQKQQPVRYEKMY